MNVWLQSELASMEEGSLFLYPVCMPCPHSESVRIDDLVKRAFIASLDGALSPMVGPGYVLLSQQFGVSVDTIASGFGSILLGLGCFMYASFHETGLLELTRLQAGSECFGRKVRASDRLFGLCISGATKHLVKFPTHLLSGFQMFISCIWCALSPGIASIRASRVFQGFGMSAMQR